MMAKGNFTDKIKRHSQSKFNFCGIFGFCGSNGAQAKLIQLPDIEVSIEFGACIHLKKTELIQGGLAEMEQTLRRAEVGRFGLCDGSTPYIVPLNFTYLSGKIGFHCDWTGKKLDLIAKNPRCCFEVDEYMGEVSYHYDALCHLDYDSVIATGTARIEKEEEAIWQFFQALHAKYKAIYRKPVEDGGKIFDRKRVGEACCVVIDVEELTGRRERTVEGKRSKIMWRHKF